MGNKLPYIATNGLNNFLVYAENTATLIGDENNCFSSGFKIVVSEDTLKNITREYLTNTYGKVESKGHADFIVKLAKVNAIEVCNNYYEGLAFCFFLDLKKEIILGFFKEEYAKDGGEKLITIPLPHKDDMQKPKTPEQELRDELIAAMDDSGTAFTYAEYMAKYLLSNYELTKKPQ